MLKEIKPDAKLKTYATEENARKAFTKWYDGLPTSLQDASSIRVLITKTESGRYRPIAIGVAAVNAGSHFHFLTVL